MSAKAFYIIVIMEFLLFVLIVIGALRYKDEKEKNSRGESRSAISTNSGDLLGTGIVKSVDRSDPVLRDAGLEKINVELTSSRDTVENWQIIIPMAMVFQEYDEVDVRLVLHRPHTRSLDSTFIIVTRRTAAQ